MAKKNAARRKAIAESQPAFDDSKYGNVLYSMTFDYNELSLTRASELLAPRMRGALSAASFISLAVLVLAALAFGNQGYPLLIALFLVSVGLLYASSNIARLRLRYARTTTLDPAAYDGALHVAVEDDAIHVHDAQGAGGDYPLSELKTSISSSEGILAGFGSKRYVFVPRSSMSESRFHELARMLAERCPKK